MINRDKIIKDLRKLYAKDKKVQSIISTGDSIRTEYTLADVVPLPEGHILNQLTGLPGLPFNKITQIAGRPDTGKSTLAGEVMASAQKADIQVVLFDSEDKFDAARFQTCFGGKAADILLVKTNEILKGGELARRYIDAIKDQELEAKILFVWDSVGGSQSRSHAERELDSEKHSQPGQDAKENGSVMKMLVGLINKYPDSISVLLINQTYAKIGFMQHGDAISGGTKIEYHSSFIAMLKRIKVIPKVRKGVELKTGIVSKATVIKNHLKQGDLSTYKADFLITAKGTQPLLDSMEEPNDSDEAA